MKRRMCLRKGISRCALKERRSLRELGEILATLVRQDAYCVCSGSRSLCSLGEKVAAPSRRDMCCAVGRTCGPKWQDVESNLFSFSRFCFVELCVISLFFLIFLSNFLFKKSLHYYSNIAHAKIRNIYIY